MPPINLPKFTSTDASADGSEVSIEAIKRILNDFVAQMEVTGVDRQRLQALVKEITFDRGKGLTSVRLRLHEGGAQALGMADGLAARLCGGGDRVK